MDAERSRLISFMETNQIWYVPLKGIILKDYYQEYGMREMSDNDILYDPSGLTLIEKYMKSNGYSEESKGYGNHDVFIRQPYYRFEMHHDLVDYGQQQVFVDYYRDPEKFLLKDPGSRYGRHFSDEEFYIFFVVHAFEHFERDDRNLSRKLLAYTENAGKLTASETGRLNTMVVSGVYGTTEQYYKNSLKGIQNQSGGKMDLKAAKRKCMLNRLLDTSDIFKNV